MLSLSRLPSYIGIAVLFLSLIYLFQHGTIIQSNLDSNDYWHTIKQKAETQVNHFKPQHQLEKSSSTSVTKLPTGNRAQYGAATPTLDAVATPTSSTSCSDHKPNLILSAIDGSRWQDQIFIFMQSLEIAVGEEILTAHRHGSCPPASVQVKIIVPQELALNLPSGFKALMRRYPSLEFVGALPDIKDVPVVLRRFQGWANYMGAHQSQYAKVLACDLDVVFQRNPFSMEMKPNTEILYFAEWRGLKIGQCSVHVGWFDQCANIGDTAFITRQQSEKYMHKDRICAGSVYGTARAIKVYMDTMASQLKLSSYGCNDQAMHIHIFYSDLLNKELRVQSIGKAELVPNDEALFGSVGTTPMVTFNEWGEILNEIGVVQVAVHQYKTHSLLSDIVWRKYGWFAEVGHNGSIPAVAQLTEEPKAQHKLPNKHLEESPAADDELDHSTAMEHDLKHARNEGREDEPVNYQKFLLANVSANTCGTHASLCSCKYEDCQVHYEWY